MLGRMGAIDELAHRRHEIFRNGAAYAAIGKLDNVLLAADIIAAAFQDLPVDADVTEFVDHQSDPSPLGILQEMADQGRLAGAEKAGDDGCGNFLKRHGSRLFDKTVHGEAKE